MALLQTSRQPQISGLSRAVTHEVFNQPPPLQDYDVFRSDAVLTEGVRLWGEEWMAAPLSELGRRAGSPECVEWGFQANSNEPVLHTYDRFGNRVDEVDFHPSWHRLLEVAIANGMHGTPWRDERRGAHVFRAAEFFVWSQVESGMGCPVSMTYAAVPALRRQPELAAIWEPLLTTRTYDPGLRPPLGKSGVMFGMAMTEKQGGTDLRSNTSVAEPVGSGGPPSEYVLTGHKWFCSAPMSDAFLVLAQAPGGLSCFLMPRVLPDGARNTVHIQRLKDKLGNRSNASSEIEFQAATAFLVGEEGRGVRTIVEMVNSTRLDCVIGSASLMRQALAQAIHHSAHRQAFGKLLVRQPLMGNVLADLALESEAATLSMLRLAHCVDADERDQHQALFKRIATAVSKYWVTKRAPVMVAEALECLGGNGYVEESIMPRLLREAPVNSIWEGSGNVNVLDVLRAMARTPEVTEAYFAEIQAASGTDRHFDAFVTELQRNLADPEEIERRARRIVESMALALQASLLLRYSPPYVADAFCASRLGRDAGFAFGTLPRSVDFDAIVHRNAPPEVR